MLKYQYLGYIELNKIFIVIYACVYFAIREIKLTGSHMQGKFSTTELYPQSFFKKIILSHSQVATRKFKIT